MERPSLSRECARIELALELAQGRLGPRMTRVPGTQKATIGLDIVLRDATTLKVTHATQYRAFGKPCSTARENHLKAA